ncbi:uncharacterized protein BCR38DRAFT_38153 [Pseudomassariella vexata]|uniref:Uncharacterized protein n=1 Tax=Pseudomassariella vexata TaxID=1141098 RepID=A0A1Y2DQV1_9PEZI|nr:uncharacterized protein BCR38DRAFT_38153 [Pseudomassariella vexata]ORY61661.1 hypothetical protein BCR38DRAFT_38153 [Pseudomassariella vexata]
MLAIFNGALQVFSFGVPFTRAKLIEVLLSSCWVVMVYAMEYHLSLLQMRRRGAKVPSCWRDTPSYSVSRRFEKPFQKAFGFVKSTTICRCQRDVTRKGGH